MITFPVAFNELSQAYDVKFTPAFSVRFSVYVPGRINIVSPDDAAVSAEAIVV